MNTQMQTQTAQNALQLLQLATGASTNTSFPATQTGPNSYNVQGRSVTVTGITADTFPLAMTAETVQRVSSGIALGLVDLSGVGGSGSYPNNHPNEFTPPGFEDEHQILGRPGRSDRSGMMGPSWGDVDRGAFIPGMPGMGGVSGIGGVPGMPSGQPGMYPTSQNMPGDPRSGFGGNGSGNGSGGFGARFDPPFPGGTGQGGWP